MLTFDGSSTAASAWPHACRPRSAPASLTSDYSPPVVRLNSGCLTGGVFGSQRYDCGHRLREAVEPVADAGGFVLCLGQAGRGIRLYAKVAAYGPVSTPRGEHRTGCTADARDYTVAAQMLSAPREERTLLLSNDLDEATRLGSTGVEALDRVPTRVHLSPVNRRHLATKAGRGAHAVRLRRPAAMSGAVPCAAPRCAVYLT
jgi:GTP cyclohydrolase II